jgi:tRNA A-37 threonylcarbamoyl transferase component Bud32
MRTAFTDAMKRIPASRFVRGNPLFRRWLWIWPVLGLLASAAIGIWVRNGVESAITTNLANELDVLLQANVTAMRMWLEAHVADAQAVAADPDILAPAQGLLQLAQSEETTSRDLLVSPYLTALRESIRPLMESHDYADFSLIAPGGRFIASGVDQLIGGRAGTNLIPTLEKVMAGKTFVTAPFPSRVMVPDEDGVRRAGVPIILVLAPLRDAQQRVIAAIGLRLPPEKGFSEILSVARLGASGETLAFNRQGLLASAVRFEPQLRDLGLLPEGSEEEAILNLSLRDPGADLPAGGHPELRRGKWPLIHLVTEAVEHRAGVDVVGHRDYRGVEVVAAWTWLPELDLGIATKVDRAEAYQPLQILYISFYVSAGMSVLGALVTLAAVPWVRRFQREARQSAITGGKLGQYILEEPIGEGGFAMVYRARHVLLRRPVALKILKPAITSDLTIARFEREVQTTSLLTHPNTVAIYDYGHTEEGLFYYAMEYLDGISLRDLVGRFGPLPEGRVIHIMRQICGSLAEAHGMGLVHRDISPGNVLLNRRGGQCDVVKVVDFGLVKAIDQRLQMSLTMTDTAIGTPQYMSPEAIRYPDQVDAHSDLYSLGALGFFMLTGRPPFEAETLAALFDRETNFPPPSPSQMAGAHFLASFEALILACLAKEKAGRPASALALDEALASCAALAPWTVGQTNEWWQVNLPATASPLPSAIQERTLVVSMKTKNMARDGRADEES